MYAKTHQTGGVLFFFAPSFWIPIATCKILRSLHTLHPAVQEFARKSDELHLVYPKLEPGNLDALVVGILYGFIDHFGAS